MGAACVGALMDALLSWIADHPTVLIGLMAILFSLIGACAVWASFGTRPVGGE